MTPIFKGSGKPTGTASMIDGSATTPTEAEEAPPVVMTPPAKAAPVDLKTVDVMRDEIAELERQLATKKRKLRDYIGKNE